MKSKTTKSKPSGLGSRRLTELSCSETLALNLAPVKASLRLAMRNHLLRKFHEWQQLSNLGLALSTRTSLSMAKSSEKSSGSSAKGGANAHSHGGGTRKRK